MDRPSHAIFVLLNLSLFLHEPFNRPRASLFRLVEMSARIQLENRSQPEPLYMIKGAPGTALDLCEPLVPRVFLPVAEREINRPGA